MIPLNSREVVTAIQGELDTQPECIPFRVSSVRSEGKWLVVMLQKVGRQSITLDDTFEGSEAWWPKPDKGRARVLMVDVDENEVVLCDVTGPLPAVGEMLFLYPPRFLESLREAWKNEAWVGRINSWLANAFETTAPLDDGISLEKFPWLRRGQRGTESLPGWPMSFVWGPPGTGKTRTLGAIVASLVTQQPDCKILLASTTNSATDQALVSIDEALAELGDGKLTEERRKCQRIGTQFLANHYEHRKHLLPQRNEQLLKDLIEHNRNRPDHANVSAMADWKARDEDLRKRLRNESIEIISKSRVSALTTTRASFDLTGLKTLPTFDYLIIDEASQVSLAHAMALLPLAKRVLFAGDPEQLSPICQCEASHVMRWLGKSAFELRTRLPAKATGFLSEQSRMAAPICEYVSNHFYKGQLVVCDKAAANPKWHAERDVGCSEKTRVSVYPVMRDGYFTQAYEGFCRHESAERVVELVKALRASGRSKEDIQVLTPFRAQRKIIRKMLRDGNCIVPVSTVHRAQGSEKKIIIFDPVDGGGKFLDREEGYRLINVAFSRAQAQLHIMLSSGDALNLKLAPLGGPQHRLPLVCELAGAENFPQILVGKQFGYLGMKLTGKGITRETSLKVDQNGREVTYGKEFMQQKCGDSRKCPKGFTPHLENGTRCCSEK
jgi:hypothetical protein